MQRVGENEEGDEEGASCPITLEPFEEGDDVAEFPGCNHLFGAPALREWLKTQDSCPVCRRAWPYGEGGEEVEGEGDMDGNGEHDEVGSHFQGDEDPGGNLEGGGGGGSGSRAAAWMAQDRRTRSIDGSRSEGRGLLISSPMAGGYSDEPLLLPEGSGRGPQSAIRTNLESVQGPGRVARVEAIRSTIASSTGAEPNL